MSDRIEDFQMPFGKYRGETLSFILAKDARYLDWLRGLDDLREPLKSAIEQFAEKYESDIDRAIED